MAKFYDVGPGPSKVYQREIVHVPYDDSGGILQKIGKWVRVFRWIFFIAVWITNKIGRRFLRHITNRVYTRLGTAGRHLSDEETEIAAHEVFRRRKRYWIAFLLHPIAPGFWAPCLYLRAYKALVIWTAAFLLLTLSVVGELILIPFAVLSGVTLVPWLTRQRNKEIENQVTAVYIPWRL